jgi:hypothetical protein
MHLHRFFVCTPDCLQRIHVPVAIPIENSRSQIPWPAGASEQIFLCPACNRARAYTRTNFLLDPTPSSVIPDICAELATYKISVPCGEGGCAGLIEVHAVLPKGADTAAAVALMAGAYASNIPCSKGLHRHNGRSLGASAIRFEVAEEWSITLEG